MAQCTHFVALAHASNWHSFTGRLPGRARQLYPGISDFDLLCDLKGIVDLDAKVPHRALNFLVPKRIGFILRISYVIESQGPAARDLMLPVRAIAVDP